MSGVDITPVYGSGGFFRVFVTPPNGIAKDVTFFRDVPTQINSMTTVDPFGAATAQVTFPAVTLRDRAGTGDLYWMVPNSDIDIVFYDSETMRPTQWAWEGFTVSEDFADNGRQVTCKGAIFQLDNFMATPTYPQQPIPYELLIKQAFDPQLNPSLRTKPLKIVYPSDWATVVPTYTAETPWYLRPWGVRSGDKWTGLTTRSTGTWEPRLTGHVQTLLSVMYTDAGGQWTVRGEYGRQPVLQVRPALRYATEDTLVVDVGAHGVDVRVSRDFTQSTNVVYAQGQDLAGTTYSGMQVTSDGKTTFFEPFAALPQVYPAADTNERLLPYMMRKESMLQIPQGIDEISAREIAQNQIRKHADPGFTGSITLKTDPMKGSKPFSRMLIRAGDNIMVRGLAGTDILFHVAEATVSVEDETTSLTVDTKFRDTLTVSEVQARTRDALDPVRLLQTGRYSVTIQDLIKPWSYSDGSGIIPSGGKQDATELFNKLMPTNAQFPWEDWTKKYPPYKYPQYYIKIGPKNASATRNWAGVNRDGIAVASIPVKMSQAGTIRLSQIAAYNAAGEVVPVRFHVGIYGNSGVNPQTMPMIPQSWLNTKEGQATTYKAGERYPFFPDAFESQLADGTEQGNANYLLAAQADQAIAWGNYYEPAGYSPGLRSRGAPKSGKLVDETAWTFDTSTQTGFDKYNVKNTQKNPTVGMMYVMIFCDDQGNQPVYFLGRLFRQEPSG